MLQLTASAAVHPLDAEPGPSTLSVLVRTDVPLFTGVSGEWESAGRARLGGGLGFFPGSYLDLINDLSVSSGWYDQLTADLIDLALKRSLMLHVDAGMRPWSDGHFLVDVGFQVAWLGGGATSQELVEAMGGPTTTQSAQFRARASDTMFTFGVGWEFEPLERGLVRIGLGGATTVGARAKIWREDAPPSLVGSRVYEGAEWVLEDTLKTWVHAPTIDLAVGWRVY